MCHYFPKCVLMSWNFSVEVGVTAISQPTKKKGSPIFNG
jgi:hypothetical protein